MPLIKSGSKSAISQNIREFHTGKTYAHTAAKFGKEKANKQAIAAALSTARRYGKKYAEGGDVDPLTGAPLPEPLPQFPQRQRTPINDDYVKEVSENLSGDNPILGKAREGLKQTAETPGNYMEAFKPEIEGKITEGDVFRQDAARAHALNWAPGMALGMVGIGRLPGAAPDGSIGVAGAKLKQPQTKAEAPPDWYYSAVERAVDGTPTKTASPQSWHNIIKKGQDVKAEEMDWLGLPEWLGQQKGPLTKDQVADYVRSHRVDLEETMYGNTPEFNAAKAKRDAASDAYAQANNEYSQAINDMLPKKERERLRIAKDEALVSYISHSSNLQKLGKDIIDPKYPSYSMPGISPSNKTHREFLLRLPDREAGTGKPTPYPWVDEQGFMSEGAADAGSNFYNAHYREPNILAHVRTTDRNIDGYNTLMIEELQSDWHQAGSKKGYLKTAAEQAADRHKAAELREQVANIDKELSEVNQKWSHHDDWFGEEIGAVLDGRPSKNEGGLPPGAADLAAHQMRLREQRNKLMGELDDINHGLIKFGKVPDAPLKTGWQKMAMRRLVRYAAENGYDAIGWAPSDVHIHRWGEERASGMIHHYDNVMPNIMGQLGRKYGAKPTRKLFADYARDETHPFPNGINIHHMALPEQMRADALRYGYPLFRAGGTVEEHKMAGGGFNPYRWLPHPPNLGSHIHPVGGAMPRPMGGAQKMAHVGMINSTVPGRTDKLPMNVRGGSYVIPASVVSGMAQGNSMAGADALNKLFGQGPYGDKMRSFGTPKVNFGKPMAAPKGPMGMPRPKMSARGGEEDGDDHVPIIAAGGEFVIPPEAIIRRFGGLKKGHQILDEFVMHMRRQTIKDMKNEKPPKR